MLVFVSVLLVLAGLGAGWFLGRRTAPSTGETLLLRQSLQQKEEQLQQLQSQVNEHFHETSQLFSKMSEQYRSVYQHLSKSASKLCNDASFQLSNALPRIEDASEKSSEQPAKTAFTPDSLYQAYGKPAKKAVEQPLETSEAPKDYPTPEQLH